jgi:membrane-bound lytic murein transglycosylase D
MTSLSRRVTAAAVIVAALSGCAQLPERSSDWSSTDSDSDWDSAYSKPQSNPSTGSEANADVMASLRPPPTLNLWERIFPFFSKRAEKPESDNLWDKIRNGFALPDHDHPMAIRSARWYASHPGYLERVMNRGEAYLYLVADEVEKRGMPMEIVLLPVIESAYQPFAYSPSHAVGLWQFIASTGRDYGLKHTSWYDGRRDILASTRAALDYLQKLHADFDGDWLLALAAYNCGEGTVQRAIDANKRRGKPTDYWSLDLPQEAEKYVPYLLGVTDLVEEPAKFSIDLPPIPNNPYLAEVEAGGPIKLSKVAEMAGIPVEEVYRLNPGYHRGVTDAEGSHRLLLPVDCAEKFKQRLAQWRPAEASQPAMAAAETSETSSDSPSETLSEKPGGQLLAVAYAAESDSADVEQSARERHHIVYRGETLSQIARHYGLTVGQLQRANGLKGKTVQAGADLVIPTPGDRNRRLAAKQPSVVIHTVARGETSWRIARRYGITVKQLMAWNHLSQRNSLKPGQRLVLHSTKEGHRVRAVITRSSVQPADGDAGRNSL